MLKITDDIKGPGYLTSMKNTIIPSDRLSLSPECHQAHLSLSIQSEKKRNEKLVLFLFLYH